MSNKKDIDMRFFIFPVIAVLTLGGCGKQQTEEATSTMTPPAVISTPQAPAEPVVAVAPAPRVSQEEVPPVLPAESVVEPSVEPVVVVPSVAAPVIKTPPPKVVTKPVAPAAAPVKPEVSAATTSDVLALAKQSGCLACHGVEKKVVGPAWKDVSTRYKGEADARARLIAKVKAGGKGNWTEVTNGMSMPPYSPRVSDQNIEILVDFVLSLAR